MNFNATPGNIFGLFSALTFVFLLPSFCRTGRNIVNHFTKQSKSRLPTPHPSTTFCGQTTSSMPEPRKLLVPSSRKQRVVLSSSNATIEAPRATAVLFQDDVSSHTYTPTCGGHYHTLTCGHIVQTTQKEFCAVNCVNNTTVTDGFNCRECAGIATNIINHQLNHSQKMRLYLATSNGNEAAYKMYFEEYVTEKTNIGPVKSWLLDCFRGNGRPTTPIKTSMESSSLDHFQNYNQEAAKQPWLYYTHDELYGFKSSTTPPSSTTFNSSKAATDGAQKPTQTSRAALKTDRVRTTTSSITSDSIPAPALRIPGKHLYNSSPTPQFSKPAKRHRNKIEVVIDPVSDKKNRGTKRSRDSASETVDTASTSGPSTGDCNPTKRRLETQPITFREPQFRDQHVRLGPIVRKRGSDDGAGSAGGDVLSRPVKKMCDIFKQDIRARMTQDFAGILARKRRFEVEKGDEEEARYGKGARRVRVC